MYSYFDGDGEVVWYRPSSGSHHIVYELRFVDQTGTETISHGPAVDKHTHVSDKLIIQFETFSKRRKQYAPPRRGIIS